MSSLAILLLVGDPGSRQDTLVSLLESKGFTVMQADSAALAIAEIRITRPDLILYDTTASHLDIYSCAREIQVQLNNPTIPKMFLAKVLDEDITAKARELGVADLVTDPLDSDLFVRKTAPLIRLSAMVGELESRVALARKFGVESASDSLETIEADPQILFIKPQAVDTEALREHMDGNVVFTPCDDLFAAEDLLYNTTFDAVILDTSHFDIEAVEAFCVQVRNNSRLFNMPVILLVEAETDIEIKRAMSKGASDLIIRPWCVPDYAYRISRLVTRQQTRWQIRRAMETTRDDLVLETVSATYSPEFTKAHLAHLIEVSHRWNRNLTLVFFKIPNITGVRESFGEVAADHLVNQVGQWLHNLTRVEDVVCRYSDNMFCIILTGTPQEEAETVMHRIAGVLSYTDFALHDVYQAISIWIEVGIAQLEGKETVEDFIERARQNIG